MKNIIRVVILMSLTVSAWAPAVLAQEAPEPNLLRVQIVEVITSKTPQFEAAVQELLAGFAEHKLSVPVVARQQDDLAYRFIAVTTSLAALDTLGQEVQAIYEKMGAKYQDIIERIADAARTTRVYLSTSRPDLSYVPEDPELAPEDINFYRYLFYYFDADKQAVAEANAKAYIELFEKHDVRRPFNVYTPITGSDIPFILSVIPARNAADFYTWSEQLGETLGEEGEQLNAQTFSSLTHFDQMNVQNRPDLSYQPDEE